MNFYHSVALPDGTVTPGTRPANMWEIDQLPERVEGLDVLDIGAYDGYYSFEAEKRGAKSVTAIDVWGQLMQMWYGSYFAQSRDAFDYCHKRLGSKVVFHTMSVYDMPWKKEFDLVIFSQVFYHLDHPLLALQKIVQACRGHVLLETICNFTEERAVMEYISHTGYCNDMSNIWHPTWECLKRMFTHVGLKVEWFKDRGGRVICWLSVC